MTINELGVWRRSNKTWLEYLQLLALPLRQHHFHVLPKWDDLWSRFLLDRQFDWLFATGLSCNKRKILLIKFENFLKETCWKHSQWPFGFFSTRDYAVFHSQFAFNYANFTFFFSQGFMNGLNAPLAMLITLLLHVILRFFIYFFSFQFHSMHCFWLLSMTIGAKKTTALFSAGFGEKFSMLWALRLICGVFRYWILILRVLEKF